jgi:peroxiredoxin
MMIRCYLFLLLSFSLTALAEIYPDEASCKPLAVGSPVPESKLWKPSGTETSLKAELAGKPAVILFFRGTWCPLCTLAMAHLAQAQPTLEKLGYEIIAISSEAPTELAAFAPVANPDWKRPEAPAGEKKRAQFERERLPEKSVTYRVLTDPSGALAEAFGIAFHKDLAGTEYERLKKLDLIQKRDGKHWLPLPGVFLTDASGTIRFVDLNRDKSGKLSKNYNRRIQADALIEAAQTALK